jgi:hypothetical protein
MVRLRKTAHAAAAKVSVGGEGEDNTPAIDRHQPTEANASPGPTGAKRPASASECSLTPAAGEAEKNRKLSGWAEHPNSVCKPATAEAKKFRLLLARFLDLDRPIVTPRMLAFLRQDGCLAELGRFIANPTLALADEVEHGPQEGSELCSSSAPDITRRAFRSLKMLVDDARVTEMLRCNLSTMIPVVFEIFGELPEV